MCMFVFLIHATNMINRVNGIKFHFMTGEGLLTGTLFPPHVNKQGITEHAYLCKSWTFVTEKQTKKLWFLEVFSLKVSYSNKTAIKVKFMDRCVNAFRGERIIQTNSFGYHLNDLDTEILMNHLFTR